MYTKKSANIPLCFRDELPPKFERIKNGVYKEDDPDYPIHLYLQDNDINIEQTGSEIVNFLKEKRILVTGATGFLGKLLVEKLLRACHDIKVYVIIRSKKGKDMETRMKEMLESYVFHNLSKVNPTFHESIIGINGDLTIPGLGINEEDRKMLTDTVNIIYHAGATVRFDEPLRKAFSCNVLGMMEILKLAKECKNLEVVTHVSTAFSNCNRSEISERFYEPKLNAEQITTLVENLSDDVLEKITPELLGDLPNTYTLTKQTVEDYIKREAKDLPICICRPSIVIYTDREPCYGWVDNIFGPVGYVVAVGLGFLHISMMADIVIDMVPADLVVNHCIAASYKTALEGKKEKITIYNYTSSSQNPLNTYNLCYDAKPSSAKIGYMQAVSYPYLFLTTNNFIYKIAWTLLHTIPAYFLDFALICSGKKPLLKKAYQKLDKFTNILTYFLTKEIEFDNTNTRLLWNRLNNVDKKNFNFDITSLDWKTYMIRFTACVKELVLHESFEDTMDQSRKRKTRLIVMTIGILAIEAVILVGLVLGAIYLVSIIFKLL